MDQFSWLFNFQRTALPQRQLIYITTPRHSLSTTFFKFFQEPFGGRRRLAPTSMYSTLFLSVRQPLFCAFLQKISAAAFAAADIGVSGIEDVSVHALEGFPDAAGRQGEVHADVTVAMERAAVLDGDADVPKGLQELVEGPVVGGTPVCAVSEEHIGALGFGNADAVEMVGDVLAGEVDVFAEDLAQFIDPLVASGLVSADEGVHGEDVHLIVVGQGGLLGDAVADPFVIDDMVAADESGEVEGLGRCIEGNGALACILADGLGWDVLVALKDEVAPDLVGDDEDIMFCVEGHGLLDLPAFPDAAGRVVRGTEYGGMDVVVDDLLFHIVKVHAPDAVGIFDERGMNDVVAVVGEGAGETNVGRGMHEHIVTAGAENGEGTGDTAEDAVLIADGFLCQSLDAVAPVLPVDDGVIIIVARHEVAEGGMLDTADDGFLDGGNGRKVHIGDPHGDGVEAILWRTGHTGQFAKGVNGEGILAAAIHDGGKIIGHDDGHSFSGYIMKLYSQ